MTRRKTAQDAVGTPTKKSVTVKMDATDLEEFKRCASLIWPGLRISNANLVFSLAKKGLEACLKGKTLASFAFVALCFA